MFTTNKNLREEIKRQKEYIKELQAKISLTENNGLKKCKGLLCKGCAHAVWMPDLYHYPIVIGCDVEVDCKDFSRLPSTSGDYYRQSGADQACNGD